MSGLTYGGRVASEESIEEIVVLYTEAHRFQARPFGWWFDVLSNII